MQRSAIGDVARVVLVIAAIVLLALGLLYSVRAQTPAIQTVPLSRAIEDVQNDRVDSIVMTDGTHARLALVDGELEATNTTGGENDPLLNAVTTYNRTKPARTIAIRYENTLFYGWPALSVLAALLPMLLLTVLVLFAAYVFTRARRGDVYERLARIADLRDRGALTEDEFQREKRRLLG